MYKLIDAEVKSDLIDLCIKFIREEVGEDTILTKVLKKGIAIHHAGLSDEIKQVVEFLIRKNLIKHICATTTVAQGMNFPVSTVYFDDMRKGRQGKLSINDFQNIVGRAGRTLVDSLGKIVFPFNTKLNATLFKSYLSREAEEITSALLELILNSERIITVFSGKDNPSQRGKAFDEHKSLSSLVQYLVHLLSVSNSTVYSDEIEELFKDSLGYYLLDSENKKKFIDLCRTLYTDLQTRTSQSVLKYADKTGFSPG